MFSIPTPWAAGLVGVAIALIVGFEELRLYDVRSDLKNERELHDVCKTNLNTSRNSVATLTQSVTDQNTKIDGMAAELKKRDDEAQARARAAMAAGEQRKREAARLGSGPDVMNAWQKALYQ